jgi:trk system potassium uptake protein TrkH
MMNRRLKEFKKKLLGISPPIFVFISFLFVILTGSILLSLPIAAENNQPTAYIHALFTSTSATCVTGLIIFDTADHWSTFGEIVIISLIQIGGLGLITLATFFMGILGRKSGLKTMSLAQESINYFDMQNAVVLIRRVVIVVFGIELIGAVLLSIVFVPEFGLKGIYYGMFHSISAFCNAGFDLMGGLKSMSDYNANPIVIYTINSLIVIGGLGFMVWQDLWNYRITKKLQIHTKIVVFMTVFLLISGSLFIFFVEGSNPGTMGKMSLFEKINAANFLSVNARTAGYATFDLNKMFDISKVFTSILMFIGAASGSTGGGIKVNTLGVLIIAMVAVIASKDDILFNKRRISNSTVLKAMTITILSGFLLLFVTMTVGLVNPEFSLVNILFESTSAFGTVGLSVGVTTSAQYNVFSEILHILLMFIGRIGPMTFAITLSLINRSNVDVIYPEGKIVVG